MPDDVQVASAGTGTVTAPQSVETAQSAVSETEAPTSTDPFEGLSAEEVQARLRAHPNPVVREALRRHAQSEADKVVKRQDGQHQEILKLSQTLEQVRGMKPEEFHSSVVSALEEQVRKGNVSAEVLRSAQYQIYQSTVEDMLADLGEMTPQEKTKLDPNNFGDFASWRKAYYEVRDERTSARAVKRAQSEERKAAEAAARAEARNAAPTQEVNPQGTPQAQGTDLSHLRGTGRIAEALRLLKAQ